MPISSADRPDQINPNTVQVPYGGPASSRDINSTMSRLQRDNLDTQRKVADLETRISETIQEVAISTYSNSAIEAIREKEHFDRVIEHRDNVDLTAADNIIRYRQDFRTLGNLTHELESAISPGTFLRYPLSRRARLDARFGEVTLPFSSMVNLFRVDKTGTTQEALWVNSGISVRDLTPETPKEIIQTDTVHIISGDVNRAWTARVAYPEQSSVNEVILEVTIQVPQQFAREANILTIETVPMGSSDITEIKYSDTSPVPSIDLLAAGLLPVQEAGPRRWIFAPVNIVSLSITLRCRRWIVEDAHKVFYVGLRDVSLFLTEFDATYDSSAPGGFVNNGIIDVIDLPLLNGIYDTTIFFDEIHAVKTVNQLATSPGPPTDNGIRLLIFDNPDFTGGSLFDSATDPTPTFGSPVSVVANTELLYIVLELDIRATNLTPILSEYYIDYLVRT